MQKNDGLGFISFEKAHNLVERQLVVATTTKPRLGLSGRRRTYHPILKLADNAL
jgi:hypothetical protein